MRKWFVFVMLMIAAVSAEAQWNITPEVGMNVTKYKDDVAKMGYKAGAAVSYTFGTGRFSIQSGLYFVQRGKGQYTAWEMYGTSLGYDGKRGYASIPVNPALHGHIGGWMYGGKGSGSGYGNNYISNMYPLSEIRDFELDGVRYYRSEEHRGYIQLPVLARFNWKVGKDIRFHLAFGPYFAYGITGKRTYGESNYSVKGQLPYDRVVELNPFHTKEYMGPPRFDWGLSLQTGVGVKRVALKLGYDLGMRKEYQSYSTGIGINYHTASFTIGYTF